MGKAKRDKKGRFAKGSTAPKTAFKKGNVPWNKGTKDIERERERKRRWEQEHPEVRQKYIKRKREEIRLYMTEYYKKHSEKQKEKAREYRLKNPEKKRVQDKQYYEQNKERFRYQGRKRKAMVRGAEGSFTLKEWRELVKKTKGFCPNCGKNVGIEKLTADHIIPIAKGGSNYITNIQPLCKSCNSRKHTKIFAYYRCFSCNHKIEVEVVGNNVVGAKLTSPQKCPKCGGKKILPDSDRDTWRWGE